MTRKQVLDFLMGVIPLICSKFKGIKEGDCLCGWRICPIREIWDSFNYNLSYVVHVIFQFYYIFSFFWINFWVRLPPPPIGNAVTLTESPPLLQFLTNLTTYTSTNFIDNLIQFTFLIPIAGSFFLFIYV